MGLIALALDWRKAIMWFVVDLAQELGVDRGNLLKRLRRDGVVITTIPRMTNTGSQLCNTVADEDAVQIIQYYQAARQNTEAASGTMPP